MAWGRESRRRSELPSNWKALRRLVLERDNSTCVWCGNPATDVDHIRRGNDHSLDNLRSLCHTCHMRRTGRDGGTAPHRPRLKTTREPEPHPAFLKKENT